MQPGWQAVTTTTTSSEGKPHIVKGWEKTRITKLVEGKPNLSPEGLFEDLGNAIQI